MVLASEILIWDFEGSSIEACLFLWVVQSDWTRLDIAETKESNKSVEEWKKPKVYKHDLVIKIKSGPMFPLFATMRCHLTISKLKKINNAVLFCKR